MGNADVTREYWTSFRTGRADTLFYGLCNMEGRFLEEAFGKSKATDFSAYEKGVRSVYNQWKRIEERVIQS